MATGHSVDEYLETIYFLAFPIGEYHRPGHRPADAFLAGRGDARRVAGLGRRDAEAARGRGARRARRAEGGDPDRGGPRAGRARRTQAPDHRAAAHGLHGLHRGRGARPRRRAGRHLQRGHGRADQHAPRQPGALPARLADRHGLRAGREPRARAALGPEPGSRATIVRLAEHDGDLLEWFYDQGLVPGATIELDSAKPAAGQLHVRVEGDDRAIADKAAAGLFVRPL